MRASVLHEVAIVKQTAPTARVPTGRFFQFSGELCKYRLRRDHAEGTQGATGEALTGLELIHV
ncbi:MAG: hypothetical protein SVU69_05515, partial [Pseudomonadota bacterium]|nr:hypothetical protein [Pseudomonadota bacterium]